MEVTPSSEMSVLQDPHGPTTKTTTVFFGTAGRTPALSRVQCLYVLEF